LRAGIALPASRRLAAELGVSRGVVSDAYCRAPGNVQDRALERSGLVAGVRVEALSRYAIEDQRRRGLVMGYGRLHESAIDPAVTTLASVLTPYVCQSSRSP
jgi:DNA-binding transcriptional MocR family regulator